MDLNAISKALKTLGNDGSVIVIGPDLYVCGSHTVGAILTCVLPSR